MTDYSKAILAGGCFWGMQDLIRKQPGVVSTRVGYTGGDVPNATYRNHGTHAEAIEIIYDPARTDFRTCSNSFSRSTIRRRRTARATIWEPVIARRSSTSTTSRSALREDTIADVDASGLWPGKVVTEVSPGRRLLGGRARAPGLPRALPQRLHLPLHQAGLEAAATGRGRPLTNELPPRFITQAGIDARCYRSGW